MSKIIDNIDSLNKTIGELRFHVLYMKLKKSNHWMSVSTFYDYAIVVPITPCSNRIARSVQRGYK